MQRYCEKLRFLLRQVSKLHISFHAAGAGYFLVLSLFPGLVLTMALLRYTALDVADLIELVEGFIPGALLPLAEDLVYKTYAQSAGAVLPLSILTGLWSASRGIYGLMTGLNAVYGRDQRRSYWRSRGICMVYTVLFLGLLLLTLTLNIFGSQLIGMIPVNDTPVSILLTELIDLRLFLLLFIQTGFFLLMYCFLPDGGNAPGESFPGAVLAAVGWMVFTHLYSAFIRSGGHYAGIFGSVYAIALSMLWLYCCLCILFFGGVLNRYLANESL